jgi:hypothetical protein
MPIKPFAATGNPIAVPNKKNLIVETLSLQVDVTPPGTKLEAFVNYTCGGLRAPDLRLHGAIDEFRFPCRVAGGAALPGQRDDGRGCRLCSGGKSGHALPDGIGAAGLSRAASDIFVNAQAGSSNAVRNCHRRRDAAPPPSMRIRTPLKASAKLRGSGFDPTGMSFPCNDITFAIRPE